MLRSLHCIAFAYQFPSLTGVPQKNPLVVVRLPRRPEGYWCSSGFLPNRETTAHGQISPQGHPISSVCVFIGQVRYILFYIDTLNYLSALCKTLYFWTDASKCTSEILCNIFITHKYKRKTSFNMFLVKLYSKLFLHNTLVTLSKRSTCWGTDFVFEKRQFLVIISGYPFM